MEGRSHHVSSIAQHKHTLASLLETPARSCNHTISQSRVNGQRRLVGADGKATVAEVSTLYCHGVCSKASQRLEVEGLQADEEHAGVHSFQPRTGITGSEKLAN